MKQFTVYAPNHQQDFAPAYVVAFTHDGPVAYAMNKEWEETAEDLERKLNTTADRPEHRQPDPTCPRRMQ